MGTMLIAPSTVPAYSAVLGLSGTEYQVDANGFVDVTDPIDVAPLVAAGFSNGLPLSSQAVNATNGLTVTALGLLQTRSDAGVPITATATGGAFGVTMTAGASGSAVLKTENAKGSTVTDKGNLTVTLPPNYQAGEDITLRINANTVKGSGTITTKTIDAVVTEVGTDGKFGADICATAAQATTETAANYDFTITGTTLAPGDQLVCQITQVVTETGGAANSYGTVNAVSIR